MKPFYATLPGECVPTVLQAIDKARRDFSLKRIPETFQGPAGEVEITIKLVQSEGDES